MAILKQITGNLTDVVIVRKNVDISVSKVHITCRDESNDLQVRRLYLDDGTTEYDIIANVTIPVGASLEVNIPGYNYKVHDLKIKTTNSSDCTLIIQ
jgi:hypothetical protein|tara:strand:+ start:2417 stop:2707 length:291 start_codon:yes stop_codon:yes gene_type:complete